MSQSSQMAKDNCEIGQICLWEEGRVWVVEKTAATLTTLVLMGRTFRWGLSVGSDGDG